MSDLSLQLDEGLLGTPAYGDLLIASGDLTLTSDVNPQGTDSIRQFVTQRLRTFLGESFMDVSAGLPWYQQIFVKQADQVTIDGLLKDCILGTPGVTALLNYTSQQDLKNRRMSVSFTVQTATGSVQTSTVTVGA